MTKAGGRFWCDFFDDQALKKGLRMTSRRRVDKLALGQAVLVARVIDETELFQVVITWLARSDRCFEALESVCSCPIGNRCEHAVSACFELLKRERTGRRIPVATKQSVNAARTKISGRDREADEVAVDGADQPEVIPCRQPPVPREPIAVAQESHQAPPTIELADGFAITNLQQLWLQSLSAPAEGMAEGQNQVVARLHRHQTHGWQVSPLQIKLRKDGRWGIVKHYRSWHDLLMGNVSSLPTLLQRLARYAAAWKYDAFGEDGILRYAESAQFEALLAAGLLTMEPIQFGALSRGPDRAGAFVWAESGPGWRLEIRIDGKPPEIAIAHLDRLWWISATERQLGMVGMSVDGALLGSLLRMPPLPLPLLGAAVEKLRRIYPALPTPPMAPAPSVPVPVLRSWRGTLQTTDWKRERRPCELALVTFRYGDAEVAARGPLMIQHGGSTVVRHLDAEAARLDELARAGLLPLSSEPTLVATQCEHPRTSVFKPVDKQDFPLAGIAFLRASGWDISGLPVAEVPISDLQGLAAEVSEDGGWFDLALGTEIDGQRIDLVPLLTPLLGRGPAAWASLPAVEGCLLVPHGRERLLRVPLSLLQGLHDHLLALFNRERTGPWKLNTWDAGVIAALDGLGVRVLGAERLRTIASMLASPLVAAPQPAGLQAVLRPYQREGLAWMQRLYAAGLGGVLADDMGLGKTVQLIAHLVAEHEAGRLDRPCLVVCPASLIGTWQRELQRFAPQLKAQILHGIRRDLAALTPTTIAITTYGVLSRDILRLEKIPLHIAVCDEAQAVKNAGTKAAQALRRLDARQRLCLTGTPLENHLGELHSQLTWAAPGLFGSRASFDEVYAKPIAEGLPGRSEALRRRLKAVLLRRTKQQVASDLPPRSESIVTIELGAKQRAFYESIRLAMDKRVRDAIAAKGLARSGIEVIEALLRLRQAACDPALLGAREGTACGESGKLDQLAEMLPTLIEEGRRILLFSQFTSFLDRIEEVVLKPAGLPWFRLDGGTRDRHSLIERFQAKEAPLFLLSLKAGGTGLTLTAADTVILADPWWNPAAEAQAADRAHRIGQTQPVLIYRLVAAGTIEEKVIALQARKKALSDALYDESGQSLGSLSTEDLSALLAPL